MSLTQSLDAEQSVLGAMLLDPEILASVFSILNPEHFSDPIHKKIYQAMIEIDEESTSIDVITVADNIGMEYIAHLGELADMTPSTANAAAYAEIVLEKAKYRRLSLIGSGISLLMDDSAKVEEVEEFIGKQLSESSGDDSHKTQSSMDEAIKSLIQRTDDRFNGKVELYSTGIADIDSVLQLEAGRMMVIAGRPGTGKSTYAQNIIEHNASKGVPCFLATMEMEKEEVAARIICSQGGVNSKFLQDPDGYTKSSQDADEQWAKFAAGVSSSKGWPLEIDYCPGLKLADFKRRARAFFHNQPTYREHRKGILAIDYLGLMKMAGDNRVKSMGEITKALKTFAGEMGLPLLLLAQLNRGVEQRPNKRPTISDLRDSGEIEEDADIIALLYRDELYNDDSPDKGIAEINFGKMRGGEPATVRVLADLKHYRFKNIKTEFESQGY